MSFVTEKFETLVIATRNKGKLAEIKMFMEEYFHDINIIGLSDLEKMLNIEPSAIGCVKEDENFYALNALKKVKDAVYYIQCYSLCPEKFVVMADDSGLHVADLMWDIGNDILKAQSTRLAGTSFPGVDTKIFEEAIGGISESFKFYKSKTQGNARLEAVTLIACLSADPKNHFPYYFTDVLEGRLADEMKGNNGFGFDSFFLPVVDGKILDKTMGEMSIEEKNKISSRYLALKKAADHIKEVKEYLQGKPVLDLS